MIRVGLCLINLSITVIVIECAEGEMRAGRSVVNLDFTFDLFICVAILTMYSKEICKDNDIASIYGVLNRYTNM